MARPFARSSAMLAAVAGALALASLGDRLDAIAGIGPYRSRGKGRGSPSRRYGNGSGHTPHQGAREMARRVRQIREGKIDSGQLYKGKPAL